MSAMMPSDEALSDENLLALMGIAFSSRNGRPAHHGVHAQRQKSFRLRSCKKMSVVPMDRREPGPQAFKRNPLRRRFAYCGTGQGFHHVTICLKAADITSAGLIICGALWTRRLLTGRLAT